MQYQPVTSSNVASVGYDESTQTLGVRFKNGSEYHYADVPQEEYESLLAASSVGQAFNSNIKDVYDGRRV